MSSLQKALKPAKEIKNTLPKLEKLRCTIFDKFYNPDNLRVGVEVWEKPLLGPSLRNYYGSRTNINFSEFMSSFRKNLEGTDFKLQDQREIDRLQYVEERKRIGKGAPKKKNEKVEKKNKKKK